MNINDCDMCRHHGGEYRIASFTAMADDNTEVHLCHHCHWLTQYRDTLNQFAQYVQDVHEVLREIMMQMAEMPQMRQEILTLSQSVLTHTEQITKLCERFAGRN